MSSDGTDRDSSQRNILLVAEVSTLRTRQEEIFVWMNQQKGRDSLKTFLISFLVPILLTILIGLLTFFYNDMSGRIKELSKDFHDYRLSDAERTARIEKELETKK